MSSAGSKLRRAVADAKPKLASISESAAALPRAPGKWSRKEIVGHLIDSASNNHERFVRAQFTDELICPTYDQDAWVRVQHYADAPWEELVSLWAQLNAHIARVMDATPESVGLLPRKRHNLDRTAFRALSPGEQATLEYFMQDYVVHLEHHLAQIFEPLSQGHT